MSVVRPPKFNPKWRRRQRWSRRWYAWRPWLVVVGIIALGTWFTGLPTALRDAELTEARFTLCGERSSAACVIDGDTIAFGKRRVRLTGFDAPELDGACEAEQAKARQARGALQEWLNQGAFFVDGGQEPPRDQYGRELRTAWRTSDDGREDWLAEYMTEQGLAADISWGSGEIDWCAA